jgi:hypothetical protein
MSRVDVEGPWGIRGELSLAAASVLVSESHYLDCKSVAKATKVRILHLPPSAPRGPDQRKRGSGPLACTQEGYFALRIPKAVLQASELRKREGRIALWGIREAIWRPTWCLVCASGR